MYDLAVKNVMRQRQRTILTLVGIAVGIAAIVALGSVAEGLDVMINEELQIIAGKIIVYEEGAGMADFYMSSNLTNDDIDVISGISDVEEAVPIIFHMEGGIDMADMMDASSFVYFMGIDMDKVEYLIGENIEMESGEIIRSGDRGDVLLGINAATLLNLEVGDYVELNDVEYRIAGILEETGVSDIDQSITMNIGELQDNLETDSFQMMYVIPDDITQVDEIAKEIEDTDDRYVTLSGTDMARQMEEMVDQIRFYTTGLGAIAAVVGGLGVMNTMIMSVMERRKEIGLMKAIGATNRLIIRQILTESAVLSLIGGVAGIILGLLGALVIGAMLGGFFSAIVTPGLAALGVGFALFLGFLGGLYPARQAISLDPVETLRYE
jgi:putative ABC transport system permease protein